MALLFFSMTKLPNSILMFSLHETKLNANILYAFSIPFSSYQRETVLLLWKVFLDSK